MYCLQTNALSQADDFVEAYRRCVQGKNPSIDKYGRTCYSVLNIPAIVNAAFACELYIKSILATTIKDHDLAILFAQLDNEMQKKIRQHVDNCFVGHPTYSFDSCLKRAANAFIDWRYIYENEHSDGYMGCLINEHLVFFNHFVFILKELAHANYKI